MKQVNYACTTAESLQTIARRSPQVHCITNAVALNYTANLLLAVGAKPTMSMAISEIPDFIARADSLSINIGTLDEQRRLAIDAAIRAANEQRKPWVLDPVLVHVSAERCRYARQLLTFSPTVIRGNNAEIAALADTEKDLTAVRLARSIGTIVAQTGESDIITDGRRKICIANGHPLMSRVTAIGCAGSALVAAFLAVESDTMVAVIQALLALAVAGEVAAQRAAGPGSFQMQILDQLYGLDEATLLQRSQVSETHIG